MHVRSQVVSSECPSTRAQTYALLSAATQGARLATSLPARHMPLPSSAMGAAMAGRPPKRCAKDCCTCSLTLRQYITSDSLDHEPGGSLPTTLRATRRRLATARAQLCRGSSRNRIMLSTPAKSRPHEWANVDIPTSTTQDRVAAPPWPEKKRK